MNALSRALQILRRRALVVQKVTSEYSLSSPSCSDALLKLACPTSISPSCFRSYQDLCRVQSSLIILLKQQINSMLHITWLPMSATLSYYFSSPADHTRDTMHHSGPTFCTATCDTEILVFEYASLTTSNNPRAIAI
jgi:hypothetical protein